MKGKRCSRILGCLVLLGFLIFLSGSAFALQTSLNQQYYKIQQIKDPAKRAEALKAFIQKTKDPVFKRYAYGALLNLYNSDLKEYSKAIRLAQKLLKEYPGKEYRRLAYLQLLIAYRETDPAKLEATALKLFDRQKDGDLQALALQVWGNYVVNTDRPKIPLLVQKALASNIRDGMAFNNLAWSLIDDDINPQLGLKLALHGEKLLTEKNFRERFPTMKKEQLQARLKLYRSYIKDTIGWGYFKVGQYKKAKTYLEEAKSLVTRSNPDVDLHLGAVLAKLGKKQKGKAMVLDAILQTGSQKGVQVLADIMGTDLKSAKKFVLNERFKRAKPAPDFTLKDLKGRSHTLSHYRGKVVVLNFFQPT